MKRHVSKQIAIEEILAIKNLNTISPEEFSHLYDETEKSMIVLEMNSLLIDLESKMSSFNPETIRRKIIKGIVLIFFVALTGIAIFMIYDYLVSSIPLLQQYQIVPWTFIFSYVLGILLIVAYYIVVSILQFIELKLLKKQRDNLHKEKRLQRYWELYGTMKNKYDNKGF